MTALALVTAATAEAHEKHGRSFENASPADRMLIVGEEFGEVNRAILDVRTAYEAFIDAAGGGLDQCEAATEALRAANAHVLHEVAQLTSLGFRWLEADGAK